MTKLNVGAKVKMRGAACGTGQVVYQGEQYVYVRWDSDPHRPTAHLPADLVEVTSTGATNEKL